MGCCAHGHRVQGHGDTTPHEASALSTHGTLQRRMELAEWQPQAGPAGQQQEQLLRLLPIDARIQVHLAPLVLDTAAELLLSGVTHTDAAAELVLSDTTDTDSCSDSDDDPAPDTGSDPLRFSLAASEASTTALDC